MGPPSRAISANSPALHRVQSPTEIVSSAPWACPGPVLHLSCSRQLGSGLSIQPSFLQAVDSTWVPRNLLFSSSSYPKPPGGSDGPQELQSCGWQVLLLQLLRCFGHLAVLAWGYVLAQPNSSSQGTPQQSCGPPNPPHLPAPESADSLSRPGCTCHKLCRSAQLLMEAGSRGALLQICID